VNEKNMIFTLTVAAFFVTIGPPAGGTAVEGAIVRFLKQVNQSMICRFQAGDRVCRRGDKGVYKQAGHIGFWP
jgi:hypothetical protein